MAELDFPHLHIRFYVDAVEDIAATREAGRPIYKDQEMVCIKYVGDNKRELHAPAHDRFKLDADSGRHVTYAEYFAKHYAAFRTHETELSQGTPIAALPFLTSAKRAELKALNITTVESLLNLNHSGVKRLGMGGREIIDQARDWLDNADHAAAATKANAEVAELRKRVAELEAGAGKPVAEASDDVSAMSDDQIRAFLTERGAAPRANAARDKMEAAVRAFMADDAMAAA